MDLLPRGTVKSDKVVQAPLQRLRIPAGTTLAQLQEFGVLFSHAPVLCAFAQPVDPLSDLLARRTSADRISVGLVLLPRPIFTHLSRHGPHWNHALLFVETEQWPLVESHLLSAQFRVPGAPGLYTVGVSSKMVVDPCSPDGGTVDIRLFQINGLCGDNDE